LQCTLYVPLKKINILLYARIFVVGQNNRNIM